MTEQLFLPVQLPDDEVYDSFIPGSNAHVLAHLTAWVTAAQPKPFLTYLSGQTGAGKSHLLFSACNQAADANLTCTYISFNQMADLAPAMLQGLEQMDLVCLDDIQCIGGHLEWQQAVFDFINRAREQQCRLLVAADSGPKQLPLELPDLQSRLSWGVSYHIQPLDDEQRINALQVRAHRRGMTMPQEVARFLMNHCQRDMTVLVGLLDRLDALSLKAQHRLTIPFVKKALNL
ncbi:DnaA regulatory inactivator Hda [Saliniradius amylolyticus]|uniref:DnaA regulatory inactivator Hda n=1 Tax=Saliniradius amylolyticus TaxID=2183582 RepID=A0A2S2E2P5_9ALTE|nr:DnaA regulatory inactivator Hda [Saliniradius amylolyticus]AWL11859.1 DnaA regulatory inactivator Hda [Saliniradius amylolyticus]